MTETGTETYTTQTGAWGWDRSGHLFCTTCKGRQEVPCPRTFPLDGPFADETGEYQMCTGCDSPADAHSTITCPTCQH
jgi:hypothetical protein